jgi:hypothetical protein
MIRPRKNTGPKTGGETRGCRLWKKGLGLWLAAMFMALSLILGGCATGKLAGPPTDGDLACQDRYRDCLQKCRSQLEEERRNCEIQCQVDLDACLHRRSP